MTVSVLINGVALIPQPAETSWEEESTGGKLDGTDATGAYRVHILKAPVHRGAVSNWATYANAVLTSITTHAPGDTMRGTGVTYSSGVVSKPIAKYGAPPGGLIRDVELRLLVVV
jgi:hypothetical protein